MKSIKFAAFVIMGLFCAPRCRAECTLKTPGPLIDQSKVGHYVKSFNENTFRESGLVASGTTIKVQSYGCEDSWGWKIELLSKKPNDFKIELAPALRFSKEKISNLLDPQKAKDYQIADKWDLLLSNLQKAAIKQSSREQSAYFCASKGTLNPKDCARTILFTVRAKNDQISVTMDFNDLEN